jgi:alkylation response protein AidB-like acyl-CoA dehydrogenase
MAGFLEEPMIRPELQKEELDLILSTIQTFQKRRLNPDTLLAYDREEHCPEDVIRELLGPEVGLHLAFIPSAYGGLGGGAKDIFRISEDRSPEGGGNQGAE